MTGKHEFLPRGAHQLQSHGSCARYMASGSSCWLTLALIRLVARSARTGELDTFHAAGPGNIVSPGPSAVLFSCCRPATASPVVWQIYGSDQPIAAASSSRSTASRTRSTSATSGAMPAPKTTPPMCARQSPCACRRRRSRSAPAGRPQATRGVGDQVSERRCPPGPRVSTSPSSLLVSQSIPRPPLLVDVGEIIAYGCTNFKSKIDYVKVLNWADLVSSIIPPSVLHPSIISSIARHLVSASASSHAKSSYLRVCFSQSFGQRGLAPRDPFRPRWRTGQPEQFRSDDRGRVQATHLAGLHAAGTSIVGVAHVRSPFADVAAEQPHAPPHQFVWWLGRAQHGQQVMQAVDILGRRLRAIGRCLPVSRTIRLGPRESLLTCVGRGSRVGRHELAIERAEDM